MNLNLKKFSFCIAPSKTEVIYQNVSRIHSKSIIDDDELITLMGIFLSFNFLYRDKNTKGTRILNELKRFAKPLFIQTIGVNLI